MINDLPGRVHRPNQKQKSRPFHYKRKTTARHCSIPGRKSHSFVVLRKENGSFKLIYQQDTTHKSTGAAIIPIGTYRWAKPFFKK